MSLEIKITELSECVQKLTETIANWKPISIEPIAAGGQEPSGEDEKAPRKRRTKAEIEAASAAAQPASEPEKTATQTQATTGTAPVEADPFSSDAVDDGFGDAPAAEAPTKSYTPDQARAALFALRDAGIAVKGVDAGKKIAGTALAELGIKALDGLTSANANDAVRIALNHARIGDILKPFQDRMKKAGVEV